MHMQCKSVFGIQAIAFQYHQNVCNKWQESLITKSLKVKYQVERKWVEENCRFLTYKVFEQISIKAKQSINESEQTKTSDFRCTHRLGVCRPPMLSTSHNSF